MNKYIVCFILLTVVCRNSAQSNVSLFAEQKDSIEISNIENELRFSDETIKLKNLMVANCQMDSILRHFAKENSCKYISNYYLTLAKHNENLYIEIVNIDTHNNIVNFYKRGLSSDNYLRKGFHILGCIVYNGSYFYVISFPMPNSVNEEDIDSLFIKTNKDISIEIEKIDDSFYFLETPVQLYQFTEGKVILLNSR